MNQIAFFPFYLLASEYFFLYVDRKGVISVSSISFLLLYSLPF